MSDHSLSHNGTTGAGDSMKIQPVAEMLAPEGLETPELNALVPNEDNYTVLLMQPHGDIAASEAGVQNRDRDLARRQFGRFLACKPNSGRPGCYARVLNALGNTG